MYKISLLIIPLMLASLACLKTTITPEPEPEKVYPFTETPGPFAESPFVTEDPSGAVWTPSPESYCAIVTASESLHLRAAPNEKAAVVAYLAAGEQVTLNEAAGTWWTITTATGAHGYSNSTFLQVIPCQ